MSTDRERMNEKGNIDDFRQGGDIATDDSFDIEGCWTEREVDEHRPERKRKKRKKKRYMLKLLVLCGVLLCTYLYITSDRFAIKEIRVRGNENIETSTILKLSRVKKGDNIFFIRKKSVANAVESNPYIYHCKVEKSYPDRILIDVREKKYAGVIKYGKRYALIDKDGYLISVREKRPKTTLINGISIKKMEEKEKVEVDNPKKLKTMLKLLESIRKADMFFLGVNIERNDKVKINVYKRLKVVGDMEVVSRQIENGNLKLVLQDLYMRKKNAGTITFVDNKYCSYSPR